MGYANTDKRIITIHSKFISIVIFKTGIPVLSIHTDNVDSREWDDDKIRAQVTEFIESRLLA